MNKFFALIPAAGSSSRMGGELLKPFIELSGKTVLERALDPFLKIEELELLVVLANPDKVAEYKNLLEKLDSRIRIIPGGSTRQHSVLLGLEYLKVEIGNTETSIVAVHDAARCLITTEQIKLAYSKAETQKAVTLAVPISDSVVEAQGDKVSRTVDRKALYAVQTPQVFAFDLIFERHVHYKAKGFLEFTDDCALLEGIHDVYLVPGSKNNIKITTKEDLLFAQAIIDKQEYENRHNRRSRYHGKDIP